MARLHVVDISASALTAERLRMNLIADNIANANSTGGPDGPYRRKVAVLVPAERGRFSAMMSRFRRSNTGSSIQAEPPTEGVQVAGIVEDESAPILRYDPEHPDAGEDGYVRYPDIDLVREMVDLLSANRSYQANVAALNASKEMTNTALQIGK